MFIEPFCNFSHRSITKLVFLCQYDPVPYESAADPNSPEGVEINLRRLTSGDDTLQQVSREELKQAYVLHASLDPTFEENAVLIAAQTLSEDPVVNAAGWEAARHEPTLLAWVTQLQTAVAVQLAASGSEGRDFLTAIARATRDTTVQKKIIQILVNTHPRVIRPARQERESPSQPRQRTPRFVIHASASALPPFEIFNSGVAVATPFILELPLTLRPREVELTSSGPRDRDLELAALVAGGFHSRNIFDALKKRGYTVVLVSPRFTPSDSRTQHEQYLEVLKEKWTGTEVQGPKFDVQSSKPEGVQSSRFNVQSQTLNFKR